MERRSMTKLRTQMQEELLRRNYSKITIDCYTRHVAEFAKYFGRCPTQLGPEEIKQFQLHLIQNKKAACPSQRTLPVWPLLRQNRSSGHPNARFAIVAPCTMWSESSPSYQLGRCAP